MKYLITLFLLLVSIPAWALTPAVKAVLAGGGAAGIGACSTVEIVPTTTTGSTNWAAYPSGTVLDAINELIAARNINDSAWIADTSNDYLTMRFTLPGNCNVTAIRAEIYADGAGVNVTLGVDISNDNSTYTSAQSAALANGTPTAVPKTFSALAWTTPTYCYVRFTATSETSNNARIYSLSITVNP